MDHEQGEDLTPASAGGGRAMPVRPTRSGGAEVRRLWESVFTSGDGEQRRSILVAGSEFGEGATQIATALALAGAAYPPGRRVVLVDADAHRPGVPELFGIRSSPGLLDVMAGRTNLDSVLVRGQADGLSILPVGRADGDATALLQPEAAERTIRELTSRFDRVIIDSAPVNPCPETAPLARFTGGVLLVIHAGFTRHEAVAAAIGRIQQAEGRLIGVVLNNDAGHG